MPRQREARATTGAHRCRPLREVQQQYRHERGLSTSQLAHRTVLQHDILHQDIDFTHLQDMYFDAFEELDIADDSDEEEEYHNAMDEIEIAMVMNRTERSALNQEETANFDIDPNTQQTNDYGPNIMRT